MSLLVGGVNHRTAPLAVRERLAVHPSHLPDRLRLLRQPPTILEVAILSTCNRTECYIVTPEPAAAATHLAQCLSHHSHLPLETVWASIEQWVDGEAVRHLFRVTAGLDSMVLGESEVTAQVKQAYQAALAEGTTGVVLNRLFQKALHAAKLVRSRTRIGEGCASIGSVAVALVKDRLGERFNDCDILLWGAGKAAEATVRHLLKHRVGQLWVVNRTQTKAQELASLCAGGWLSWEEALKHLAHVDVAIVCTQAPHYVIDEADLAAVLPKRGGRPLILIDLAVPRNVEPTLARHAGVHLYNIDDLQRLAQATRAQREQEGERCDALIQEQVRTFCRWWRTPSDQGGVPCRTVEISSLA